MLGLLRKSNRKKTKFENFFSFKRYRRRFGIRSLSRLINFDFESQKNIIVSGEETLYTHGSSDDISEHFLSIRKEFIGHSELCLTHAKLIILLKRGYKTSKYFEVFKNLWEDHHKFLIQKLNTRWLISACDTFSDFSDNNSDIYLSIASSLFINTIKLYESERILNNSHSNIDDQLIQNRLDKEERIPLPDGMSVFKFGTDDTLRNLSWRLKKIPKNQILGKILCELFSRANHFDSVFLRTKKRHKRKKTSWWN